MSENFSAEGEIREMDTCPAQKTTVMSDEDTSSSFLASAFDRPSLQTNKFTIPDLKVDILSQQFSGENEKTEIERPLVRSPPRATSLKNTFKVGCKKANV
jgi:hypothetical protein